MAALFPIWGGVRPSATSVVRHTCVPPQHTRYTLYVHTETREGRKCHVRRGSLTRTQSHSYSPRSLSIAKNLAVIIIIAV